MQIPVPRHRRRREAMGDCGATVKRWVAAAAQSALTETVAVCYFSLAGQTGSRKIAKTWSDKTGKQTVVASGLPLKIEAVLE